MTTGRAAESEFEHLRADGTLAHVHLQAFAASMNRMANQRDL